MSNVNPSEGSSTAPAPVIAGAPRKKKRRWKLRIALGILALLIASEISLRVFADYDSRFTMRIGAECDFDPQLRTRWKKNFHSGDINTNSRGFLGPEFEDKKRPGSYRIVCLGDSASSLPAQYTYPAALEKHLRERRLDRPIDVINASCPGYASHQSRIWYEREVNAIEHDMLIIYSGWNDMGQYNPDGLAFKLDEVGYLKAPSLFDKLILNVYLLRSLYVIQGYWERNQPFDTSPLEGEDLKKYTAFYPRHFEDNICAVIELAKAKGRLVYMLNWGGLVVKGPDERDRRLMHFPRGMGRRLAKYLALMDAYHAALRKISERTGTPIIDVETWFQDPAHRTVFYDSAHFGVEGSDAFANLVADVVVQQIP